MRRCLVMSKWKDQIDTELGEVTWDKRKVYEKIQRSKRKSWFVIIPTILTACIAIMLIILTLPKEMPITTSAEKISLQELMENSSIEAYYYSVFNPMYDRYIGGIDERYLGTKKGDNVAALTEQLSNLELHDSRYYGYGLSYDMVVHFDDGTVKKLQIGEGQVIDIDTGESYWTSAYKYYQIFNGESYPNVAINKWFHTIFLILIGFNLVFFYWVKQPVRRKSISLAFNLFVLILTWVSIFNTFEGDYLLTKTMLASWFIGYLLLHICFVWIGKLKGQEMRVELYKMVLYGGALWFVWDRFFF